MITKNYTCVGNKRGIKYIITIIVNINLKKF